jgi:hypothetical protein
MAHFAKLGIGNIVESVIVVHNNDAPTEKAGIAFIKKLYLNEDDVWKQTSLNTVGGIYFNAGSTVPSEDQSKAFRKNHPAIGYTYDEDRDAFIAPKPYDSWTLNETTCLWEPPVERPIDETSPDGYVWNEITKNWD